MVDSSRVPAKSWSLLAGLLAVLLAISGCGSTSKSSSDQTQPVHSTSTATVGGVSDGGAGSQHVDPQVLSDVIDTVFTVPGADVLRGYRVYNFLDDFGDAACGATVHYPIDRTWQRYSQNIFPDLDLIKKKGFNDEPQYFIDHDPRGINPKCNEHPKFLKAMPVYQTWLDLQGPWQDDVLLTVEQDPSVVALKAPFAQCLRDGSKGTGIVVSSVDPASTFMNSLDLADYRGTVTPHEYKSGMPNLFARCGKAYFGRTATLLMAKRPAAIERNRELLEKAASQLVAIGYTP